MLSDVRDQNWFEPKLQQTYVRIWVGIGKHTLSERVTAESIDTPSVCEQMSNSLFGYFIFNVFKMVLFVYVY